MTAKQYPVPGDSIDLNFEDGTHIPVYIDHMLGAARIFQGRNPDGETAVIAIQPDGTWWIIRDFGTDPDWRADI